MLALGIQSVMLAVMEKLKTRYL